MCFVFSYVQRCNVNLDILKDSLLEVKFLLSVIVAFTIHPTANINKQLYALRDESYKSCLFIFLEFKFSTAFDTSMLKYYVVFHVL